MTENRICIIKVGSAVVTTTGGILDTNFLLRICRQTAKLPKLGWSPIIVSSGAKVAGQGILNAHVGDAIARKKFDNERRILSSIGQAQLIMTYARFFHKFNSDIIPAQLLITRQSLTDWNRYKLMRETIFEMIENNIVPIINNNDVAHDPQIDFSDNDQVATYLAAMVDAKLVIFVSDAGGVFDKNPNLFPDAKRIEQINGREWPEISVDDRGASFGGMTNKLEALRVLATLGIPARIAAKSERDIVVRSTTKPSSRFGTRLTPRSIGKVGGKARFKRWLATGAFPTGMILVSAPGADRLVDKVDQKSVSLLAVGVVGHHGVFSEGDTVALLDNEYKLLAVGLTRVSSTALPNVAKESSGRVVVHTDQMVLATDAGFCAANLKQFICAHVQRIRSDGFDVLESRGGKYPDYGNALIRIGNRLRKSASDVAAAADTTEDEILYVANDARISWMEAIKVGDMYGVSPNDWLLFREFS